MKVLVIEGDKETAFSLKGVLQDFFIVETALSGNQGEYLAQYDCFDLIILGAALPDMHGAELCKKLRQDNINTPVLILSTQPNREEKIRVLLSGADDYLVKSFEHDEFLAHIWTLLRRPKILPPQKLTLGGLTIDLVSKTVLRNGHLIELRRKEYFILEYLMRNAGKVVTRQTLIEHVWETSEETLSNVVDVHIKYLRDQIDKKFRTKLLKTVHGMGYKIEA